MKPIHFLNLGLMLAAGLAAGAVRAEPVDPAPAGIYVTDPAHSSLVWSLDHMGLSQWTARFSGVSARLDWRPGNPQASVLTVEIDPASLRTDFPVPAEFDFDAELAQGDAYLQGRPILFRSQRSEITGPGTGRVHGLLTLRGIEKPVVLDVRFNGSMAEHPHEGVAKLGFSATGEFLRSDWGMDTLLPDIGDRVRFVIETQMAPAPDRAAAVQ